MVRPDPGAVPRRRHHISSIAHLYLQEDRPADHQEPVVKVLDVAVATPGQSPISAFASAALALGSTFAATLSEDHRLRWSAGTFLAPERDREGFAAPRNGSFRNFWTFPAGAMTAGSVDLVRGKPPEINWSHLGNLGSGEMSHLESLAVAGSLLDLPRKGDGGLVWCLQAADSGRLESSYMLGRLVEFLHPRRLEILIFPDAWSQAGRPGWLENISGTASDRDDPTYLERCGELAALASGGIPLGIHPVVGPDNLAGASEGNGRGHSIWRRVAGNLMTALAACLVMAGLPTVARGEPQPVHALGRPGYLVIEAARDSTAGFRWEAGPGPGFRSLTWDQGRLILPDSLAVEDFSRLDVGIACTAGLTGTGASGQLVLRDGIYPVSEPVVLTDDRLKLELSAGELEIRGARIRYRRTLTDSRDFQSNLLMLAGMTLLVVVLLRRARLKSGERAGT